MRIVALSLALSVLVLWALGCGGGASTPTTPSTPNPGPAGTTINIVGTAGNGAFNPNPVQVPSGGAIVWRNATGDQHVLVMNDGTSIGTIAPGASVTTTLNGGGGNYHCTNHPSMVGSINGATAPTPPPGSGDGY